MPRDHQFGLFSDDDEGRLWRAFFTDLDAAMEQARRLADDEGRQFVIYNLKDFAELVRFFPAGSGSELYAEPGSELTMDEIGNRGLKVIEGRKTAGFTETPEHFL